MREIIFSYFGERCHAKVVDAKPGCARKYIGCMDGYEIYNTGILFDPFGFVAIRK